MAEHGADGTMTSSSSPSASTPRSGRNGRRRRRARRSLRNGARICSPGSASLSSDWTISLCCTGERCAVLRWLFSSIRPSFPKPACRASTISRRSPTPWRRPIPRGCPGWSWSMATGYALIRPLSAWAWGGADRDLCRGSDLGPLGRASGLSLAARAAVHVGLRRRSSVSEEGDEGLTIRCQTIGSCPPSSPVSPECPSLRMYVKAGSAGPHLSPFVSLPRNEEPCGTFPPCPQTGNVQSCGPALSINRREGRGVVTARWPGSSQVRWLPSPAA